MIPFVRKCAAATPDHLGRALRRGLVAALWAELKQLNSLGLSGGAHLSRRARAARVRAALARKYREHTPCC
jgi:hypothetical protein